MTGPYVSARVQGERVRCERTPDEVALSSGRTLRVVAFSCSRSGLTACDRRTGGACLSNFWPLPERMQLEHNGVSASFSTSEAAYRALKWCERSSDLHLIEPAPLLWPAIAHRAHERMSALFRCFLDRWSHKPTRKRFEACSAPGLQAGEAVYELSLACESDSALSNSALSPSLEEDFAGLGAFGAMLTVLRVKSRIGGPSLANPPGAVSYFWPAARLASDTHRACAFACGR